MTSEVWDDTVNDLTKKCDACAGSHSVGEVCPVSGHPTLPDDWGGLPAGMRTAWDDVVERDAEISRLRLLIEEKNDALDVFAEAAAVIPEDIDDNEHVASFPMPGRDDGAYFVVHVSDLRRARAEKEKQ